jgi:hypothetical protein
MRESMRGLIAAWLLALLSFLIVLPLVGLFAHWASIADLTKLLEILFTPIVGLVGAATGFYYGQRGNGSGP